MNRKRRKKKAKKLKVEFIYQKMSEEDYETLIRILAKMLANFINEQKEK